ncbi:MAG: hypothetical protein H7144_14825 [Burkholderiales bacterium]|nr:hypothetical protein [Phycisphaerae bacterium]
METNDFAQPLAAASAMVGFHRPWCVYGGWAIDLWLGEVTRQHKDVEIAVLRDHQIELRDYLQGWTFKIATMDKRLVPWKDGRQMLMLPIHELHATDRIGRQVKFLLNESDGIDWIYRHDFDVRMNLSRWITHAANHVPVLCPQIALLYKSKSPRHQDELDFRVAIERLDDQQRTWLKLAIVRCDPAHRWLERL